MTTYLRLLLGALALAVPAWALSQTTGPGVGQTTGRVLVLKNHRALEGDIERIGEEYRLRRPSGELTLPADRVLALCAGWEEALALVSRLADLRDPDERLRLAKWCQMNGLHAEAIAQVGEALRIRPEHRESKYLLSVLQRSAEAAKDGQPARLLEPPPPPAIDLSAETLTQFTSRVQPILMNACASCHVSDGSAFKLVRCTDATVNRLAVQHNLAATLAQVNMERPAISPLLVKSASAHGGAAQAPLTGRQSKPFQTLNEWVESVLTNNPHLKHVLSAKQQPPAAQAPAVPAAQQQAAPVVSTDRLLPPVAKSSASPSFGVATTPAMPAAAPKQTTTPLDRHDPEIFNRLMHQQK